jgi:Uncharacterized conserved protein (DUF2075)
MNDQAAWFSAPRTGFVSTESRSIVAELSSSATREGWHIEKEQHVEWQASVESLQEGLSTTTSLPHEAVEALRRALAEPGIDFITDVVLEYNIRRRGLRIDCVLLGAGVVIVVEFKRSKLAAADRDQVMNYCVNLAEFHEETQLAIGRGAIVVPILVTTAGATPRRASSGFARPPWNNICDRPLECSAIELGVVLQQVASLRRGEDSIDRARWIASRFSPSSTILDAAISLYGEHNVSAIDQHAAPVEALEACTNGVLAEVKDALAGGKNRIVFVSGAPGAGKTLVGLKLAFSPDLRERAVFVTGNAPLVEVLSAALKDSYRSKSRARGISGYSTAQARYVVENATFKIVKAHHYLGERGTAIATADERVVIFDEAQRTYEKGRQVLGKKLANHEADLVLESLERSFSDGAVVVALLGHNQTINRGERGAIAWLEAGERRGWQFSIGDDTLALDEFSGHQRYATHKLRRSLPVGHLETSLRYYRNAAVEKWAHEVLKRRP